MAVFRDNSGGLEIFNIVVIALLVLLVGINGWLAYDRTRNDNQSVATSTEDAANSDAEATGLDETNSPDPATDPALSTYSDTNVGGFTVQYPSAWNKLTCPNVGAAVYLAPLPASQTVCNSDKPSLVAVFSVAGDNRVEKSCGDATNDQFRTNTVCAPATIADAEWLRVSYTTTASSPFWGAGVKLISYATFAGDRTYMINYTQVKGYPNEEPAFDQIANSFKFNAE